MADHSVGAPGDNLLCAGHLNDSRSVTIFLEGKEHDQKSGTYDSVCQDNEYCRDIRPVQTVISNYGRKKAAKNTHACQKLIDQAGRKSARPRMTRRFVNPATVLMVNEFMSQTSSSPKPTRDFTLVVKVGLAEKRAESPLLPRNGNKDHETP